MKKIITSLFIFAMALALMVIPAFADEPTRADEPVREAYAQAERAIWVPVPIHEDDGALYNFQFRYRRGTVYMPLREVAEHHGATVEWDGPNHTAIITLPSGDVLHIAPAEVGGYNDNGTVWVPTDALLRIFRDFNLLL